MKKLFSFIITKLYGVDARGCVLRRTTHFDNILMISRSRLSAALVHYIMRKTSKTDKKPLPFILCFGLLAKEIEFDFAQRGNHPAKYRSYCAAMSKPVPDQLQDVVMQ